MNSDDFYDKFPDEIREFDFDASSVLLNGDTIQSIQVLSLSTGLSIVSSNFAGSIVTFRVAGGVAGTICYAVAKLTLVSGQLREGSLTIFIKPLPGA
jgi:hypothetical protein